MDSMNVQRYVGGTRSQSRRDNARLVVSLDLRFDILHAHHEDYQGGHQGVQRTYQRIRAEYYWRGLFRDVEQHVRACVDCTTSKGSPPNPVQSPGNVQSEYPFQYLSMDFVTHLPASTQGNLMLLLLQDMFSGYVMCRPMSDTSAPAVAEAYVEEVFQRFGASLYLRSDRDPRFLSEFFTQFRLLLGSQQRATLAYRPQANGQQERSVQTVVRSVRAFVEGPGQEDWEDVVRRLMFALNTSYDATRKDAPFFIVHGWNPKSTIAAMLAPPPRGRNQFDAYTWRLKIQRDHEYAQAWARELQAAAKRHRADQHNEAWNQLSEKYKAGLEVGNQVWLYLARVQPGLSRKLAHQWHGPFRIVEKKWSTSREASYRRHPIASTRGYT